MGYQPTSHTAATFPLWDYASLPFLFDHHWDYEKMVNDPSMQAIMDRNFTELGLVKLFDSSDPKADALFGNTEIKTIDDFKGLKIRTTGKITTDALRLLGASPVAISGAEVQEALARGTVDAIQTSIGFGLFTGLTDLTDYLSLWNVTPAFASVIVANKESFDALSPDVQQILMEVSRDFQDQKFVGAQFFYLTASAAAGAVIELVVPDKAEVEKARAITRPVIDEWVERAGPDAAEVLAIAEKYAYGGK
jgi:TRAP-type C4-dicarboxylate transport system substrate-binding protein